MSDDVKRRNVVRRTPFPGSATSPLVPPLVPSVVFMARDADQMNNVSVGPRTGLHLRTRRRPECRSACRQDRGARRRRIRLDHVVRHVGGRGDPARPPESRRSHRREQRAVQFGPPGWSRRSCRDWALPPTWSTRPMSRRSTVRSGRPRDSCWWRWSRTRCCGWWMSPRSPGSRRGTAYAGGRQYVSHAARSATPEARRADRPAQHHEDARRAQ